MVIKSFSGSNDSETIQLLNKINNLACTGLSENDNGSTENSRKKRQALPQLDGTTPDWLNTEYEFLNAYMVLSDSMRHSIGHQFGALIKACTFQGSCYSFNSFNSNITGKSTGLLSSSLPGPVLGLTLVLGLDQRNYMKSGLTKGAGAR